jgi:probable phosphoglycerate mutase
MLTATFVRHAQSESNAGMRTEHPTSIQLTPKGYEQARHVSQTFETAPQLIVISPYLRTHQTAQATLERFPSVPVAEWPVQEFTFLAPVNFQGTTGEERQPAINAYWERGDPFYTDGEGAESFAHLLNRITKTRELIRAQKDGFIVIFSHGEFTRAFLWTLLYPSTEMTSQRMRRMRNFFRGFPVPNCAFLKFRIEKDEIWHNGVDVSHLPEDLLTG